VETLADRAVRRAVAAKEATARAEVQALLDATLTLIRREGGQRVPRVADIVAEAGLSNQAFYRHFAGRDELLAAVAEAGAIRLVSYLAHQMDKETDASAQITRWIEGVLAQAAKPDVADETRAVTMSGRRGLGADQAAEPLAAARELLLPPLRALDTDDPERDAAVMAAAVFDRLEYHLRVRPPSRADITHLVGFCTRAVGA
jgi:AcrR family transcriptional regulator